MNEHINDTYTMDVGTHPALGKHYRYDHNGRERLSEGAFAALEK